MLFDDGPIEEVHDLFLAIAAVGIFDEKDVLFDILQISSDFQVIDHLVHLLYGKIFRKRGSEQCSYLFPVDELSLMFHQLFDKIVKNSIRHIQVLTYKVITKKCNVFYKKIKTIFPEKFNRFFYCICFLKP